MTLDNHFSSKSLDVFKSFPQTNILDKVNGRSHDGFRAYHILRTSGCFSFGWVRCFSVVWPQKMPVESRKLHMSFTIPANTDLSDITFCTMGIIVYTVTLSWLWTIDLFPTLGLSYKHKSKHVVNPEGGNSLTFHLQIYLQTWVGGAMMGFFGARIQSLEGAESWLWVRDQQRRLTDC